MFTIRLGMIIRIYAHYSDWWLLVLMLCVCVCVSDDGSLARLSSRTTSLVCDDDDDDDNTISESSARVCV